MPEQDTVDEAGTDQEVILQYRDVVSNTDIRVVASPYEGNYQEIDDEWEVRFQKRESGTKEWNRFATDYTDGRPEVSDVGK